MFKSTKEFDTAIVAILFCDKVDVKSVMVQGHGGRILARKNR